MCNHNKKGHKEGEEIDMGKTLSKESYKKISLSPEKLKKISVTPKIKDGKLLFNRKNKNHRYIVDDD